MSFRGKVKKRNHKEEDSEKGKKKEFEVYLKVNCESKIVQSVVVSKKNIVQNTLEYLKLNFV